MIEYLERLLVRLWNGSRRQPRAVPEATALDLGVKISPDGETQGRIAIPQSKRAEHIALLGKTGTGKSSALRYCAAQDVQSRHGFLYFDLHGDGTPFILGCIADEEAKSHEDLSGRLIVIDPADPEVSVGMNPLESPDASARFVQIAEFAEVLRRRWKLDSFGARTDELLRNALYVLAECDLTLLELAPLLTHAAFRAGCLKRTANPEVRQYFELRYGTQSEAMQAVMREPILNKTTAFTADPRFRHIVGQYSTFSLLTALDAGAWIVLNLHKGKLGEQSPTLAALLFTAIKNALFARRNRTLFTLYADEVQNLVAQGSEMETMLSEARKFGGSMVSANQYLDQYPPEMRAAILAVGTHVFFQLSSPDAQVIANALDGGKALAERLKNLPRRHMVVKSGSAAWTEGIVPTVQMPKADPADLYARSRARWARKRSDIEAEIQARQAVAQRAPSEALNDWE